MMCEPPNRKSNLVINFHEKEVFSTQLLLLFIKISIILWIISIFKQLTAKKRLILILWTKLFFFQSHRTIWKMFVSEIWFLSFHSSFIGMSTAYWETNKHQFDNCSHQQRFFNVFWTENKVYEKQEWTVKNSITLRSCDKFSRAMWLFTENIKDKLIRKTVQREFYICRSGRIAVKSSCETNKFRIIYNRRVCSQFSNTLILKFSCANFIPVVIASSSEIFSR